ncbi:MAG: peptidoglycan editing factor PgeF [Betaproteobacteria bacterium]|nr:peptidoglycan editing factor PgeF [Betaproteobacteria bacterium]
MLQSADTIVPEWPVPRNVKALITTRRGGVSVGAYASLNLGRHVGDDLLSVEENRRRICAHLPAEPMWLDQVHGTRVVNITAEVFAHGKDQSMPPRADAATTRLTNRPCAVLVADCLSILFCDTGGSCVAAAHAGWRGLAAGVIERTVEAMQVAPQDVMAYLGPAIGPTAFEVGQDVADAFASKRPDSRRAFRSLADKPGKYVADIYELGRQRLCAAGVAHVYGGGLCTVSAPDRFFSYRRDGQTGRMAAFIWLE